MVEWNRNATEQKLTQYRALVNALRAKRESLDARIIFAERKVAEWEARVAEVIRD